MDTQNILSEREKTHGSFQDNAFTMQNTKRVWRSAPNWDKLTNTQREALEMIAHKVGRILNGDANYPDHWVDIAGYAALVIKEVTTCKRDYSKSNPIPEEEGEQLELGL